MKFVISPAKTLDLTSVLPDTDVSQPDYIEEAQELIGILKPYSPQDIAKLMKLSDKLATLNVERYQSWHPDHNEKNSRPAIFTFMGDVYAGLDAYSLNNEDLDYAQGHLRMLSGLYGVLRPFDRMQPYRLEMGTRLASTKGSNLYQFWGDKLALRLNDELESNEPLINLASNEYFKAVQTRAIQKPIITPVFLDEKNGQYKVISFFAKKARGLMARYLIQNRSQTLESLRKFNLAGYQYDPKRSSDLSPVFVRSAAASAN